MGWEPRTSFEYDSAGRVAASSREVEWDEEQRDLMVALQEFRDTKICPLCGGLKKFCGDSATERLIEPTVVRCYVASRIEAERDKESAENVKVQQPSGRTWGARMKSPI